MASLLLLPRGALEHTLELLFEAREATATIDQMAVAAGPGGMRLGIDVEGQRVTLFAIGGVGLKLGPVRHRHFDAMIVRVEIVLLFHHSPLGAGAAAIPAKKLPPCTGMGVPGQVIAPPGGLLPARPL